MKNQNPQAGLELQPAELEAVVGGYFPVPPILPELRNREETPPPRMPMIDPFPFPREQPWLPSPLRPAPSPPAWPIL